MKKNVVLKGFLIAFFVLATGIFYVCMTKEEGKANQGFILQEQAGGTSGEAEVISASDGDLQGTGGFAQEESEPEVLLYVHVCGAVKEPGVYVLPEGSRVADAVLCAGDFLPDAARDYLNLAQPVFDGQKIYVPNEAELEQSLEEGIGTAFYGDMPSWDSQALPEDSSHVNINTAGEGELMTLPGIGEAKAAAIVAYRKEHGAFSSCEELMQVPGIKESIYEKLQDVITVGK